MMKLASESTNDRHDRMKYALHWQLVDSIYHQLKTITTHQSSGEIVILESQQPEHPESNKTFVAAFPKRKIIAADMQVTVFEKEEILTVDKNPWQAFREFRSKNSGWLFGYIGYDMKNSIYKLSSLNKKTSDAPDLFMMEPSVLFQVKDNEVTQIMGQPVDIKPDNKTKSISVKSLKKEITKAEYIATIARIKDQIKEGDFYELNYSYPITARFDGSAFELYRKMRAVNPVPFAAFLDLGDLHVCCSSPERFLKKEGNRLISEPIKGTAARAANIIDDNRLKGQLRNEKNQAENLMIVDLVRHDLSQISIPGTINVSKLYEIQTFGTVHQLISRIEGDIRPGIHSVSAIEACFPMGSMTGAPKLRVLKEIEQHEQYNRGIYSGTIGYMDPEDNFDLNVVIRTAVIRNGRLTYPVGGAITSDSDAAEEWQETITKAKTLTEVV